MSLHPFLKKCRKSRTHIIISPQTKIIGQTLVAHDQLSKVTTAVEKSLVLIYYVAAGCRRLESVIGSGREGVNNSL